MDDETLSTEWNNVDPLDDLELLTKDELIELLVESADAGVNVAFPGKATARRIARRVRPRVQRTIAKHSVGSSSDQTRNLVIEGDNLQALTTLFRDRGHVDLIIADPPYNTGNDFRYNDRWDVDPNDDGIGDLVRSDDRAKHTKWMKFMYPRLQMMRAMLKPGGVLAICIDDRELFHLGQMLDEIFKGNRLAIINWQKSYSPRSDNRHVSTATEYVLVYARQVDQAKTGLLPRTEAMDARYKNRDGDLRLWKSGDLSGPKAKTHKAMVYGIQSPFTGEIHYPPHGKCWRIPYRDAREILSGWGTPYVEKKIDDVAIRAEIIGVPESEAGRVPALTFMGRASSAEKKASAVLAAGPWPTIFFGVKGTGRPALKGYHEDVKKGVVPMTYWADDDLDLPEELGSASWDHEQSGHSQTGIDELDAIVGNGHGFETVKPLKLFQKIIQIWCPANGVVLDPFGGSGTTGHAVLALNALSGSERRFTLIEQGRPEKGDSYARTLTVDRLKRAISGKWANGKGTELGGGFSFRQLTKQVDASALLQMEREEMVDTVIASYFDASRRRGGSLERFSDAGYVYLVAQNADNEGFYLVWDGPDQNTDLTEEVYEACVVEGARAELKPVYHVYARLNIFSTEGVRFYQIPDRILADFGLDVRTESYEDEAAR